MTVQQSLSDDKKKVLQIFRYLQALDQLRNPVKKDVGEQFWLLWFKDLPVHPYIELNLRNTVGEDEESKEDEKIILSVKRPILTEPPVPPENIRSWLQKGWQDVNGKVKIIPEKEWKRVNNLLGS